MTLFCSCLCSAHIFACTLLAFLLAARLHSVTPSRDRNTYSQQFPQRRHISAVVAQLINGRLQNKRAPREHWVIHDPAECFQPNLAFADVFVTVHARTQMRFRIVHVHHPNALDAYRPVNRLQRLFQTFRRANIPSCCECVGRINAHSQRQIRRRIKNRPQFFKSRTQRRALPGGIFKQDLQSL